MNMIRAAFFGLFLLTLLTGGIYPLIVTGLSQLFFPFEAKGSFITDANKVIGSALIGQHFQDAKYFWSRPSATAASPYNVLVSGGSNLGPLNPIFLESVKERVDILRKAHSEQNAIPIDLVTASGSGLDPHISLSAARYQLSRVAKVRGLAEETLKDLVAQHTQGPFLGFLGDSYVNVLELNLALDKK